MCKNGCAILGLADMVYYWMQRATAAEKRLGVDADAIAAVKAERSEAYSQLTEARAEINRLRDRRTYVIERSRELSTKEWQTRQECEKLKQEIANLKAPDKLKQPQWMCYLQPGYNGGSCTVRRWVDVGNDAHGFRCIGRRIRETCEFKGG